MFAIKDITSSAAYPCCVDPEGINAIRRRCAPARAVLNCEHSKIYFGFLIRALKLIKLGEFHFPVNADNIIGIHIQPDVFTT